MRFLLTLAAYAAFTISSFAQNGPQEIRSNERVDLRIGQAKTFQFDKPYSSFAVATDTVARLSVQTDRTFTITGIGPGETLVTVNFSDQDVYRMSVNVGGRTVRIYGTGRDDKDYLGYFCTSTECGRGDSDAQQPSGMQIEKRGRDSKGNIVTTTKTY